MEKEYLVIWKIDMEGSTPEEAAQKAFETMQRSGTTANVFTVIEKNKQGVPVGPEVEVDLDELWEPKE
jgi:hypothetical protein